MGRATAFNQLSSSEGREGRPALNYVRGRVITVDLDSGLVHDVTVIGKSDGVYLEPSDSARAGVVIVMSRRRSASAR